MRKRAISLALALVMCLALLPSAALAAEDDWENAAPDFIITDGVLIGYGRGGVQTGDKCPDVIVIPDGVTEIGKSAFNQRGNITSVTIPNSVTAIRSGAFMHCTGLKSIIIPDSVTILESSIFRGCTNLESVTLGSGITVIPVSMFSACSLTSLIIPDGVTTIESAFMLCEKLTNITIPASVTSIDGSAFYLDAPNSPGNTIPNPNLTIHGVAGSYAETYAKDNGYKFVATGGTIEPPKPTEKPSTWAEVNVNTAIVANLVPQDLQSAYTQATNRAEFAALAVQLYETITGKEITERKTFVDTSDINVEKAAAIGIVTGVGDNKFNPNAGLTREQAVVMLSRLASVIGKPLDSQAATFNDNGSISTWAIEQVGQIQSAGIMSGVGNNTFDPQGAYTREQSIVTILRLYDVVK